MGDAQLGPFYLEMSSSLLVLVACYVYAVDAFRIVGHAFSAEFVVFPFAHTDVSCGVYGEAETFALAVIPHAVIEVSLYVP